jgi:hypothetical protein
MGTTAAVSIRAAWSDAAAAVDVVAGLGLV